MQKVGKGEQIMFEITIVMNNQEIDMVVPKKVTLGKLGSLLQATFIEQGQPLPKRIVLKVVGKTFKLTTEDMLSDFGVGNGDKLEILIGAENEII